MEHFLCLKKLITITASNASFGLFCYMFLFLLSASMFVFGEVVGCATGGLMADW